MLSFCNHRIQFFFMVSMEKYSILEKYILVEMVLVLL